MSLFNGISMAATAAIFGFVAAIIGIIAIFFFAILGALVGAVTGWLVSLTPIIGSAVTEGFMSVGVKDPNLVSLGAMIGFIAGFFKQNVGKCNCNGWD
jgi:hypothetical protein